MTYGDDVVHRWLLTIPLAVVAGCASSDPSTATPATEAAAAIDFTAPAVGGGEIDVGAYAGRDLALWFWAPF